MSFRERMTDAAGRATAASAVAREALADRVPGSPDAAQVQAWIATLPMPTAPATDTWSISIGTLLGRSGNLPSIAAKALGLLDRFGRVSVGPAGLGIDSDDVPWSGITAVRTAPVSTVLGRDVVTRELDRIRGVLPPVPGRAAVLGHAESVLHALLARALVAPGGDVVSTLDCRGRLGRQRTITVGLAAALAIIAMPDVDRSIRATAEQHAVPVTAG
jgi:hypothetical protein